MPAARSLILAALALLAACSVPPDLGPVLRAGTVASTAPAPVILPLDALIAQASAVQITPATTGAVQARAARLRARAAAMRGPVQDPATRARLAAAIARP